jgi:transposase
MTNPQFEIFAGIDIAAKTASVAYKKDPGEIEATFDIKQTGKGFGYLKKRLLATGYAPEKILVVIEATGNYWWRLALELHEAGFALSVINPARAHYFALAELKRSKTDHIDAQTLAELGAGVKLPLWSPPPEIHGKLQQRLAEREDLVKMRTQTLNRLHALKHHPKGVESVINRHKDLADLLQKQIDEIEKELAEVLHEDDEWNKSARRLLGVKGVGIVTAAWLLVVTNNFTSCEDGDNLVSYAGLAPRRKESGTSVKGRPYIGYGGSNQLRQILYMASLSASRFNPIIKAFYDNLRERGKAFKVAVCACARKLILMCWAIVTKKTEFDPNYRSTRYSLEALSAQAA